MRPVAADSTSTSAPNTKRAILNIAVAAVVLGAIYVSYARWVNNVKAVQAFSKKAHEVVQLDTLAGYREAADNLDKALAIQDDNKYALAARAEVGLLLAIDTGDTAQSAAADKALASAQQVDANLAERFTAEGLQLVAQGRYADAETRLVKIATEVGATGRVLGALGMSREKQHKLELAANDLKQAAERGGNSPRYPAIYGELLFDQGEFAAAQRAFQAGKTVNAYHWRSLIGLVRSKVARGKAEPADFEDISKALALSPDEAPALLKARALAAKVEAAYSLGDMVATEAAAAEAINTGINDTALSHVHYTLGLALAAQKKPGAVEAFRKAIEIDAGVPRFYFTGALTLAKAGDVANGEALFAEYGKVLPLDEKFHAAKAEFLIAAGKVDDALVSAEAAISANAAMPEAYYLKCQALYTKAEAKGSDRLKLLNDALFACQQATGQREKFPDAQKLLGLVYLAGKPTSAEALEAFVTAIKQYKDANASKETLEKLVSDVEAAYNRAGLRNNAKAFRSETAELIK